MLPVKLSFLMCVLSYAQRTAALRAPPCRGFFRQEPWRGLPFPTPGALTSGKIQDGTPTSCIFCIGRQILYHWGTWKAHASTTKKRYL